MGQVRNIKDKQKDRSDFPLAGLYRQIAEGAVIQAEGFVEVGKRAVRGESTPGTPGGLKEGVDPVEYLAQVSEHLGLCRAIIQVDDDARKKEGK